MSDAQPGGGRQLFGHRALVVDDHRIFAEALAAGLVSDRRFGRVDVAYSSPQAMASLEAHRPDLMFLDSGLGNESGRDLLRAVLERRPDVVMIMVSGLEDIHEVTASLALGARAWVPKDASLQTLLLAVDEALKGRTWLPSTLLGPVLQHLFSRNQSGERPASFVDALTPRQRQMLEYLSEGMSRTEIAERLVLSPNTVRTHVQDLLRKAGVHSTLAAVARAREVGYLQGRE